MPSTANGEVGTIVGAEDRACIASGTEVARGEELVFAEENPPVFVASEGDSDASPKAASLAAIDSRGPFLATGCAGDGAGVRRGC